MAKKSKKKKNRQKHYHFSAGASVSQSSTTSTVVQSSPDRQTEAKPKVADEPAASVSKATTVDAADRVKTRIMLSEARQTALIGGSIIIVLIVLWLVFEHTAVGPHIYQLIHV